MPFETTDLDAGRWTMAQAFSLPRYPRHGAVIPVTRAEYESLLAVYSCAARGAVVGPASRPVECPAPN